MPTNNAHILEYSENTSISNVKTLEVAQIQTSDPAINISLSLEVVLKKQCHEIVVKSM
jgi:hypothetical protein